MVQACITQGQVDVQKQALCNSGACDTGVTVTCCLRCLQLVLPALLWHVL